MAELVDGKGIKTIALYLPQFHSIPENDKAWGKGFTEWLNTRKATPLFAGHRHPKTPLNNNYYCLLDDDAKIWQANLAKEYGVFGFCYYHYWFKDGKQGHELWVWGQGPHLNITTWHTMEFMMFQVRKRYRSTIPCIIK